MNPHDPRIDFPAETLAARRAAVFDALGRGVMVLPAAPRLFRSGDTEIRYRPDSELFYVTGVTEPGALGVLVGGSEPRFVLFVAGRNPERERWSGPRWDPDTARERFRADETYPVAELGDHLPGLLREADRLHVRMGRSGTLDHAVVEALQEARARGARKGSGPRGITDPGEILDELRLVKDEHEIERIRRAVDVTVEGHRAGISHARPGVGEWVVEASVNETFRRNGAEGPGFATIVGSGPNACVLHYVENRRTIRAGDLVLVDAGAEVGLYQGDVTRTFPAGPRFSPEQRALYEIVERAHSAALAAALPGAPASAVHDAAVTALVEGLVDLGLLKGTVDDLVATEEHRTFFPHQTSHWLGLDVHDPGDYRRDGEGRALVPGMVFTVEPGLYVPAGSEGAAASFQGNGVRIEDDVLMGPDGPEVLSGGLPTEAAAVEALVEEGP